MRPEKQLLLDEIKDQIEKNDSFIIMRYVGLDSAATTNFRRQIGTLGGSVEVVRKRILVKAAQAAGMDLSIDALPGHIGLVFAGEDALKTAKEVFKFKKDLNNAIDVVGGRFDGRLYNAEEVEKLSDLPSMDVMRAQLLSVLEAPLSQTLAVMDSLLCSVMHCLDNKAKK